jgi:hypothetical protein
LNLRTPIFGRVAEPVTAGRIISTTNSGAVPDIRGLTPPNAQQPSPLSLTIASAVDAPRCRSSSPVSLRQRCSRLRSLRSPFRLEVMSAVPTKADIRGRSGNDSYVPTASHGTVEFQIKRSQDRLPVGHASPLGRTAQNCVPWWSLFVRQGHRPEINPGQLPIPQHHLDLAIHDFGCEHPLGGDSRDRRWRVQLRAPSAALTCNRPFN